MNFFLFVAFMALIGFIGYFTVKTIDNEPKELTSKDRFDNIRRQLSDLVHRRQMDTTEQFKVHKFINYAGACLIHFKNDPIIMARLHSISEALIVDIEINGTTNIDKLEELNQQLSEMLLDNCYKSDATRLLDSQIDMLMKLEKRND